YANFLNASDIARAWAKSEAVQYVEYSLVFRQPNGASLCRRRRSGHQSFDGREFNRARLDADARKNVDYGERRREGHQLSKIDPGKLAVLFFVKQFSQLVSNVPLFF